MARQRKPPMPYVRRAPEPAPRRSRAVPLLLAGAFGALLWKCSGTDVQRNRYDNLQDCIRDYSLEQCTADTPVNGGGYHGGVHYYGPWYRSRVSAQDAKDDPGPGRSGGSTTTRLYGGHGPSGVELGTRGGFGSSGRVFARGG